MSKYLAFPEIVFKSRELLLGSLAELGFTQVDEGDELALYGYEGNRRPETAAIVVRRSYIGSASNDVGFRLTSEGYVPIISDFDQRTLFAGQFLPKLRVAYAERVVETVRKRVHGTLRRINDGSVIKLHVRY
jgi:hypothetical protein